MKKLSYIILGFIIGAVLTYYFCPRGPEVDAMKTRFRTADGHVKKPKGLIDTSYAKKLNENWNKFRCQAVDSCVTTQTGGKKEKDYRWTHWSLDEIENYIEFSKEAAEDMGYEMTGLRFYLGVYGKDAGEEKGDLTTMFMVPTGHKSYDAASMSPFTTFQGGGDIPTPPNNNGGGGNGGYPN
ncbi:hypothetical protein [Flavivirga eckloniae]|uniref:Uncharacterized protein n=1 Tax=Flavivirga eckloniae TaxID=1803846 RepID=A0A2K9PKC6_9FLAO|nr:hypothetical protein [Flavivirga eckloniae]AUP77519.1 hypothetical protein C1H87_01795 [Flavivirga eckloniae]